MSQDQYTKQEDLIAMDTVDGKFVFGWRIFAGRGHFDVPLEGIHGCTDRSAVMVSVTELDTSGHPKTSGAHIFVGQVTPQSGRVVAHLWVDNVPVQVDLRVSFIVRNDVVLV